MRDRDQQTLIRWYLRQVYPRARCIRRHRPDYYTGPATYGWRVSTGSGLQWVGTQEQLLARTLSLIADKRRVGDTFPLEVRDIID